MRNLAQRSAEAAKEIKQLIQASAERVEQGATQVQSATVTMSQVVASVGEVSRLVEAIHRASSQQSSAVTLISDTVTRIDQGTQQNAALVEQTSAAAESLRHQAHELVGLVSRFKLA